MASYTGKWLEVLSVENGSESHCIHIQLNLEQSMNLKWKLDSYTAYHIRALIGSVETAKYRLSLHSNWNALNNHPSGSLTKYDRGSSEKSIFPCSRQFAEELAALREIQDLSQIKRLSSFICTEDVSECHEQAANPKTVLERLSWKPEFPARALRILAATFVVAAFFLIFVPDYPSTNQAVLAKVDTSVLEERTQQRGTSFTQQLAEARSEPVPAPAQEALVVPAVVTESAAVPEVKLGGLVNFSLPKGSVALTFDDGPSKYTREIVDILEKHKVGGTFFFVGTQVRKFPEHVKYADDHGFSIGNHSMTHTDFEDLTSDKRQLEIARTNQLLEAVTSEPVVLFRPPYGATDEGLSELIEKNGMKIVLWNKDSEDWKASSSQTIMNYTRHTELSGSILLLHESKQTVQALPQLIEYLQKQKLQFPNLR